MTDGIAFKKLRIDRDDTVDYILYLDELPRDDGLNLDIVRLITENLEDCSALYVGGTISGFRFIYAEILIIKTNSLPNE